MLQFDYQSINDQLLKMGAVCSAAELHGMVCGQLAAGRQRDEDDWVQQLREFADLIHFESTQEQRSVFLDVVSESARALDDTNFAFQLLLPDDRCPIDDRIRELGLWCHSFLYGFGASGIRGEAEIPADTATVLRDFAQISVNLRDNEDNDAADEADWTELVEYARVAALTVRAGAGLNSAALRH